MAFRKSFTLISAALVTTALVYGCSSSSDNGGTPGNDAGQTADSSGNKDGTSDAKMPDSGGGDAPVQCAPADVSSFTPPAYVNANPMRGVCTDAQILQFFISCFGTGHTKAQCDAEKMAVGTACASCIEGKSTDAKWSATVVHGGVVSVNIAGCMEIKGGTAGLDCAKKSEAANACEAAACDTPCPVTDDASFQLYLACIQQAAQSGCSMYAQAAAACQQAEAMGDAGDSVCLGAMDFEHFYDQVVPIFCGGGISDAGGEGG